MVPGKGNVSTGITIDKAGEKHEVADALGLICMKTHAYALKVGNDQLAAQMNTRPDIIFKMRDADILGYTTSISDIITPLLPDPVYTPYGVTDSMLADIVAKASAFNDLIGKADQTASGNTVANTAINKQINFIRGNIKQFDLLVDEFQAKNPEFVQGYHINSSVDNTGVRHSGIEGYVRSNGGESGSVISGAIVKLLNTTKSVTTDLRGFYHIERAIPDDYMVECSANGFALQTKLQHISRGRTEEVDWAMIIEN